MREQINISLMVIRIAGALMGICYFSLCVNYGIWVILFSAISALFIARYASDWLDEIYFVATCVWLPSAAIGLITIGFNPQAYIIGFSLMLAMITGFIDLSIRCFDYIKKNNSIGAKYDKSVYVDIDNYDKFTKQLRRIGIRWDMYDERQRLQYIIFDFTANDYAKISKKISLVDYIASVEDYNL